MWLGGDVWLGGEVIRLGRLCGRETLAFGAPQLLQVVALDGLVQGQLDERLVDGEPLALATHLPRVFPLGQLFCDSHYVHLGAVLVFTVLETITTYC